jgi:2-hydroxy-3-keto-5-methylthiopentenyl-1-phosphate phosphatase
MYKVYCDFDETITVRDVGSQILAQYGTEAAFDIWSDFDSGKKSAAECLQIACDSVSGMNAEGFTRIVEAQQLKPGFTEFAEFCRTNSIELHIDSDGFSCYIREILAHNGLAHIPFWTNSIELREDGTLSHEFPNQREGCDRCASCKCSLLLTTSDDSDTIVYIGDGYSDWCPAMMADVVFACRDLKRQCGELGIPHHPFDDFFEVQAILSNYLKERPKYRREQAHRRRKELIITE